jgi:hypothetical protein
MRSNLRCWPADIFGTEAGLSVTCSRDVLVGCSDDAWFIVGVADPPHAVANSVKQIKHDTIIIWTGFLIVDSPIFHPRDVCNKSKNGIADDHILPDI